MNRTVGRWAAAAALGWLVTTAGCGPKQETFYPVKGKVTVNGRPIKATGAVALVADAAKGNTTPHEPRGTLDENGHFEVYTVNRPGAPPGWYKVLILAQTGQASVTDPYAEPKWLAPTGYTTAAKTPLTVEVTATPPEAGYTFDVKK